jgi:hypothetical protein
LSSQFNQAVRIRSILILSRNPEQAPRDIKIITNRPSIGFEDVEGAEEPTCAQVLELSQRDVLDGNRVPLRFVRFQAVNSLHVRRFINLPPLTQLFSQIFVASNHGGVDESRIDVVDIFGVPVEYVFILRLLSRDHIRVTIG